MLNDKSERVYKMKSVRLVSLSVIFALIICFFQSAYCKNDDSFESVVAYSNTCDTDVGAKIGRTTENSIGYIKIDDEHGESIMLDGRNTSSGFTAYVDKVRSCKAELISFDYRCSGTDGGGYVDLLMPGETFGGGQRRMLYIKDDGTFSNASMVYIYPSKINTVNYEAERWYHFDIWIDFETGRAEYYIDKELLQNVKLNEQITEIGGFMFYAESGKNGIHYLDNIKIVQVNNSVKNVDIGSNVYVPDRYDTDFSVEILPNNLGNTVFNADGKINIEVENKHNQDSVLKISGKIVSPKGRAAESHEIKLDLKATEKRSVDLNFGTLEYGVSNIKIKAENEQGKIKEYTSEVTVINGVGDLGVNPKIGICDHTLNGHGLEKSGEKINMLANAGMGYIRSTCPWSDIEKTPGAMSIPDNINKVINQANEVGVEPVLILVGKGASSTADSPPKTPEGRSKFAKYAEYLVGATKGRVKYFELWNEWNLDAFNESGATPEDYVLLMKEVYSAVKKANPECVLIGLGGVTNVSNMHEWIERVLKAGGANYCDAFSVHPYDFNHSAEKAVEVVDRLNEILKKYNCDDKELWSTEMGWTANSWSDNDVANFAVRYSIMTIDKLSKNLWYVSQEKQSGNPSEDKFGWMKGWDLSYEKIPFKPLPVFIAMSNYNKLFSGIDKAEKTDIGDKDVYAYKAVRPNGEKIATLWIQGNEPKDIALNIDSNNIKVIDLYGNEHSYELRNNTLCTQLSGEPIFIIGHFNNISIDEPDISINEDNVKTAANDKFELNISGQRESTEIDFSLPENITLESIEKKDMSVKCVFATGREFIDSSVITVLLKDSESHSVIYSKDISIEYIDTVNVSVYAEYFRSRRWKRNIKIKNNLYDKNISGRVVVCEPTEIAKNVTPLYFKDIKAGETKSVTFDVPETYSAENIELKCVVCLDNGESYDIKSNNYNTAFLKRKNDVKIDGVLSENEWDKSAPMKFNKSDMIRMIKNWGGVNDISGMAYCMWDKDNFYIAVEVTDNALGDTDSKIYNNDSVQFAFTTNRVVGASRTEYGFGLVNGKTEVERYAFIGVDSGIVGVSDKKKYEGVETAVTREGNKTYYEGKFPWTQIYGKKLSFSELNGLYFSLLINDNDGSGRRGWMEYCPGIGEAKDPTKFVEIPISKR